MKKSEESFEQILLSYSEMCYSVALALTGDPDKAQKLAKDVMTRAWRLCDRNDDKKTVKKKLLKDLREQFLKSQGEVCSRA